jgi:hypothetical protein
MRIVVEEDNTGFAPAAERYMAYDDRTYSGPGSIVGTGATPIEAVDDLVWQILDAEEARGDADRDALMSGGPALEPEGPGGDPGRRVRPGE